MGYWETREILLKSRRMNERDAAKPAPPVEVEAEEWAGLDVEPADDSEDDE